MFKNNYFKKELCIHHKGMIPNVAYYVVSGSLTLLKKKGQIVDVQSGEIVGLEEIWDNKPLNYNIYTKPGTVLFYLDKTILSNIEQALKLAS